MSVDTIKICIPFEKVEIKDYTGFGNYSRTGYRSRPLSAEEAALGVPFVAIKTISSTEERVAKPNTDYEMPKTEELLLRSIMDGKPETEINKVIQEAKTYQPTTYETKIKHNREFRIEFSVPKLLFGQNVSECEDNDFSSVVQTLIEKLALINIFIKPEDIENAYVSRLDYGKNVPINVRVKTIISALKNLPQSKHSSVDENKFINFGEQIRIQNKYVDYKIYDKMKDIQKNDRVATYLDKNGIRHPLLEYLESQGIKNMIRLEFSMQSKAKIKEIFDKCGIESDLTFKDVFNTEYAKKVNLYAFDTYIQKHITYAFLSKTHFGVLMDKCAEAKKTIHKALMLIGLRALMTRDNGIQSLKDRYSNTSIAINSIEQELLDLGLEKNTVGKTLKYIREAMDTNSPFRI